MLRSVYVPDNPVNKSIMTRVGKLMTDYDVSFSEIVVHALKELVSVDRPKVVKGDFRSAKLVNLR